MTTRSDMWMPFFVGDYLGDTMHLSRDQHGGYMLLIFAYWKSGAPLLDDDGLLASITKATAAEWKKLRPVLSRFFLVDEGYWHHKRIDTELEKAAALTDKRSKAGSTGAAKRWQSHGNGISVAPCCDKQIDAHTPPPVPEKPPSGAARLREVADLMLSVWAEECRGVLRIPSKLTPERIKACGLRWKDAFEGDLDQWRAHCQAIVSKPFLRGDNGGWKADFDWALTPKGILGLREGKYDGSPRRSGGFDSRHDAETAAFEYVTR